MSVVQTAGAMSALQGPRARSGNRGRGVPRGGLKPKDPRNTTEKPNGQRPISNATRATDSQHHLKPPPNQGHIRNRSWNSPTSLNAAVQSHAGKLRTEPWRNPATTDNRIYKERMSDTYQTLKQKRERERKAAIKDGFLADPDRPTSLANAITPVGTCQEMCPEFERVERIVQLMVDGNEKTPSSINPDVRVPCEELMVKRFRRSAAGYDEQLPSDIRPPSVLKKTLDYLFNTVVGGPEPLANVHKFVWDRTRGIRNDFSIQQVTRIEDLKTAIDCFERIARFHILSLHQLTKIASENGEFDHHQEREQLNNTLLSLMYYYDDSRHKLTSPNEAEFRAYCIIFEIQDQRPDLEDRAQNWPRPVLKDQRVQTAMKLYAVASNTSDEQGPLRPRAQFLTAQANTGGFWSLVQSNAVSYMMACVAEIYFNLVRRTAIEAIWKAYKGKRGGPTKMEDWTVKDLTIALGFDSEYQTQTFCEEHDFELGEREDGELYIDLGSVASGNLTDQNPRRKQIFSRNLVESKRLGRTLPAVINGLTAAQAQSRGLIDDSSDADTASMADNESLFINGDSDDEKMSQRSRSGSPQNRKAVNGDAPKPNASTNPFAPTKPGISNTSSFKPSGTFGRPSPISSRTQPPSIPRPLDLNSNPTTQETSSVKEAPKFDFLAAAKAMKGEEHKTILRPFGNKEPSAFNFSPSTSKAEDTQNNTRSSPNGTAPTGKSDVFGRPSIAIPSIKPSGPAQSPFNPLPSSFVTTVSQPENVLDHRSSSPAPPSFSFGTSPLFTFDAPEENNKTEHVAASSVLPESKAKAPEITTTKPEDDAFKRSMFPTPTAFAGPTPALFAPKTHSAEMAASHETGLLKPFTSSFPGFPTASTLRTPRLDGAPAPLQSASLLPKSREAATAFFSTNEPQPSIQQKPQGSRFTTSTRSSLSTTDFAQPSHISLTPRQPQPNPRLLLLNKLSDAMMLEDNGLLQQFIEFTVGPIITSSVAQLEDEESWKEARECRVILLGKKFFRRWRTNAWNLGLMRKGRERRRTFARSVQESARNTRRKPSDPCSIPHSKGSGSASSSIPQREFADTTSPLAKAESKRQSLPAGLDIQTAELEAVKGSKRKRNDSATDETVATPRRTKISHRRSQTLGGSIMSAPPHRRLSSIPYKPRMEISKVPEGSMLHDTLMKQARRFAPNVKSDTTHTDYFRLKALGIDPDTRVVPLTRKRTWNEAELNDIDPATRTLPQPTPPTRRTRNVKDLSDAQRSTTPDGALTASTGDDEALFAQIRSVREALAESEQWMHSERQNVERSMTPQTSVTPSSTEIETPAERRLREIREKGRTPSRSEIRLRAMGDKALLPKGFWDGEGMGKSLMGKGKQRESETVNQSPFVQPQDQKGLGLMGFAAINGQGQMNDFGGREDSEKKGASMDDAIEL